MDSKKIPLAKLTIIPLNEKLQPLGKSIVVMYNPKEFTIDSSAQYQRSPMPGFQTPVTQFVSGQTETISMDLFFDTYEEKVDVRDQTSRLTNLLKINKDLHAPPVCEFDWGGPLSSDNLTFRGVFDKITQKYTMFLASGIPVRATLSISISKFQSIDEQIPLIKRASSDRTKIRVLDQSDHLWHLADREYGDVARWRVIANANNIENPRLIPAGLEVILPPLKGE
jgi:nucleoid-associated protein YgaU